jgi:hypothetical protein
MLDAADDELNVGVRIDVGWSCIPDTAEETGRPHPIDLLADFLPFRYRRARRLACPFRSHPPSCGVFMITGITFALMRITMCTTGRFIAAAILDGLHEVRVLLLARLCKVRKVTDGRAGS